MHEWIALNGGSENVLEVLADTHADASILALWEDQPSRFAPGRVRESWIGRSPLRGRKAAALPLMPAFWQRVDLSDHEWMIVSSHAFAHQVASNPTAPERTHIYVHTPARYIWAPEHDARRDSAALAPARRALRALDRRRVNPHVPVAANSRFVADRIQAAWDKDAVVIHPPVDVARIQAGGSWAARVTGPDAEVLADLPEVFVLGASRFVRYKRLDLAIRVGELLDLPVVVAGRGEELKALQHQAASSTVPVTFALGPSDQLLRALMERAALYVFPPIEDFGIMPVESAAVGTPSLVNAVGGARESVERIDGGAVVDFADDIAVRAAADAVLRRDHTGLDERARFFDRSRFVDEIARWRTQ